MAQQAVLTDQLRASLASRSVIDQALGVIMGEERCTAQEAFEIVRAQGTIESYPAALGN
jgi:AmiR/NasT family two-component response regulator